MCFINEAVQWRRCVDVWDDYVGNGFDRRVGQAGRSHSLAQHPRWGAVVSNCFVSKLLGIILTRCPARDLLDLMWVVLFGGQCRIELSDYFGPPNLHLLPNSSAKKVVCQIVLRRARRLRQTIASQLLFCALEMLCCMCVRGHRHWWR